MAKNKYQYSGRAIAGGIVTPVASPTDPDAIITGQTDDSYVSRLVAINDSGGLLTLSLYYHNGTSNYLITAISIPAHTSSSGSAYDILQLGLVPGSTVDAKGNFIFNLPATHSIRANGASAGIDLLWERVDYAE